MHKYLVMALIGLTATAAAAQTQIDLSTQTKRVDFSKASSTKPLQTGTPLPSTCVVGQMFFKTDAPAGANLYACTATNTWSVQGGITGSNCWADASSQTLKCQDPSGNVYAIVKTAGSGTANQWWPTSAPTVRPKRRNPRQGRWAPWPTREQRRSLSKRRRHSHGRERQPVERTVLLPGRRNKRRLQLQLDAGHHRVHNRDDLLVSREYGRHGKRHAQSERAGPKTIVKQANQSLAAKRHPLRTVGDGDLRWYEPADAEPGGQCSLDRLRADRRGNGAGGRLHVLPDWRYRERSATSRHGDANQPGKYGHCGHSGFQPGRTYAADEVGKHICDAIGLHRRGSLLCHRRGRRRQPVRLYRAEYLVPTAGGGSSSGITVRTSGTTVGLRNTSTSFQVRVSFR